MAIEEGFPNFRCFQPSLFIIQSFLLLLQPGEWTNVP